jgi:serine/threonine protein kinase
VSTGEPTAGGTPVSPAGGTSAALRGRVTGSAELDASGWAPAPRELRGPARGRLAPGGLYVGAEGQDAAGWTYRLVAPLDRGGMGELFVAEVGGRGAPRHAVVKRLLPELMEDGDYVAMFRAEAEVMASLDHPSVVRVLGMPELEGAPCLALEYIHGRSTQQLVSRARSLGTRT